jgi:hypothetical protein
MAKANCFSTLVIPSSSCCITTATTAKKKNKIQNISIKYFIKSRDDSLYGRFSAIAQS